jgi:3,4-dihydroxy 2-butanone 4-phosphate synthase / GTP cyclohydrolase II
MDTAPLHDVALDGIARALADLSAGRPVVVLGSGADAHGRLVVAAESASAEELAFVIRHSTGLLCVAMPGEDLDRLAVPPMTAGHGDRPSDAFAVSVDARAGGSTGISATDRARTVRVLADPASTAADLTRPGHVVPVRTRDGGVLLHPGVAEAAADLARMAGRRPAGVLAELVADDGPLLGAAGCRAFADRHGLTMVSVGQLVAHRRRHEPLVARTALTRLPTRHGEFPAVRYADPVDGRTAVALVAELGADGRVADGEDVVLALHAECLAGDVFGSFRCDCGGRLDAALQAMARRDGGVLVHLRGGAVDDDGHAVLDEADLDVAAHVLRDLGVTSARLLPRDPATAAGLRFRGIEVTGGVSDRRSPAERVGTAL